jgi:hypothetical protein
MEFSRILGFEIQEIGTSGNWYSGNWYSVNRIREMYVSGKMVFGK